MSPAELLWPIMAGASMTLGLVHLLVWLRQPTSLAHLLIGTAAFAVSVCAVFEVLMMRAVSADHYAALLRWAHVAIAVLVLSLVGFVLLRFPVSRPWLGLTVVGLRGVALLANFTTGANLNFLRIDSLQRIAAWQGDSIAMPVGPANPWMLVAQLGNLVFIAFLVDTVVSTWRRGTRDERVRVLVTCGSLALFIGLSTGWTALVVAGVARGPLLVNVAFLLVVVAMAYELGGTVIRVDQLDSRLASTEASLHESERRMQVAIHEADARFRRLIEGATSAVFMVDSAGRITVANSEAERMFGYADEDLVDIAIGQVLPDPMAGPGHPHYATALESQAPGGCRETVGTRKDGTSFSAVVGLTPVNFGADAFMVASVADVSERVRLERETVLQRDELAHLSRVALLGEMSGSLAHELNQPLTAVLSNAQAALRYLDHDPPNLAEVRDCLVHVVESDKRASEVIRRLRAMLRKDPTDYQELSINGVVDDVLGLINSDLLNRNVSLVRELAPDLPAINGDRVQLQQVLLNLVINACDAMDAVRHPRTLVVRTQRDAVGVKVSISDNGPGILADDLERIFIPFVTDKPDGIGLGLPICRTLIQAHRGTLWATTNTWGGATLNIILPAGVRPLEPA